LEVEQALARTAALAGVAAEDGPAVADSPATSTGRPALRGVLAPLAALITLEEEAAVLVAAFVAGIAYGEMARGLALVLGVAPGRYVVDGLDTTRVDASSVRVGGLADGALVARRVVIPFKDAAPGIGATLGALRPSHAAHLVDLVA
jgi:hypothetical protein